MFEITIKGETLDELSNNILLWAARVQPIKADTIPVKPTRKAKAAEPAPEPEVEDETVDIGGDEVDAELLAPAPPAPETANSIVDAGTGKPAPKASAKGDTITMTFDDVKVAAAKLVAKDQAKLAEILKTYGASKLTEVPKDKLGDFAADVMEALG